MLPQCSHITRKRGVYYYRRRVPKPSSGEIPALTRAIARQHVGGLLRGLGLFNLASSISYVGGGPYAEAVSLSSDFTVSPVIVSIASLGAVTATGRLFRLSPGDAGTRMFGEEIFIGVQNEVIGDLHVESDTVPMILEPHYAHDAMRGADGLIVARQSAVTQL